MGFIDFIRGKYDTRIKKEEILEILVSEMTETEKDRIIKYSFDELWEQLWMNKNSRIFKNEYKSAKIKYESMDVVAMVKEHYSKWKDSEFCIPKGRRNNHETPEYCSIREFSEETGIKQEHIRFSKNKFISEIFYGSNGVPYKHVYYIAEILEPSIPDIDFTKTSQAGEVKKIGWFSYKEAMNKFRDYESTKRCIIHKIFTTYFS